MTPPPKTRSHAASAALFFALTLPALAQLPAAPETRPTFEVASIRPDISVRGRTIVRPPIGGRFVATKVTLETLIELAYQAKSFEISGGPGWIRSDRYNVAAKSEAPDAAPEQLLLMLQTLLEDRFKLTVHRETKEMHVYALLPAKQGLKLPEAAPRGCATFGIDSPPPAPHRPPLAPCDRLRVAPTWMEDERTSMPSFASALAGILGRPVSTGPDIQEPSSWISSSRRSASLVPRRMVAPSIRMRLPSSLPCTNSDSNWNRKKARPRSSSSTTPNEPLKINRKIFLS